MTTVQTGRAVREPVRAHGGPAVPGRHNEKGPGPKTGALVRVSDGT